MVSDRKRIPSWLWFPGLLAVAVLFVFWEPLFSGLFLWGPDSGSYGYVFLKWQLPGALLGQWVDLAGLGAGSGLLPINPYHLFLVMLPDLKVQVGLYIVAVLGTVLAGLYFLRGYGIRGWPAFLGALAMGFTAHTFTVIAAGHMSKILSIPFVVLLLASVHRAVTRRLLVFYALAGLSAAVGFNLQADMMFLFLPLAAAYGLMLFLRTWPRQESASENKSGDSSLMDSNRAALRRRRLSHFGVAVGGAVLVPVFFLSLSVSIVQNMFQTALPQRARLAQAAGDATTVEQNKWEFATNWSLPPEDIVEFVAPCIFGIQTGDPRGPYWGRLGRTLGWERHHRGLMNLRQHTVYLGVIQLVFGCLAVAVAFRRRRPGEYGAFADASNAVSTEFKNALTMPVAAVVKHRADVIFFGVFFVVAVLLALGRNFPLYRLFYSVMPFAENLRAPVKFLHLAEISLCALLAFGLDYFCVALSVRRLSATGKDAAGSKSQKRGTRGVEDVLAYGDNRLWKVFAIACAGIGICVLFGLGVASARERELVALWTELGLGNASDVLMRCMTGALVRASILFLLCGGIFWMARIKGASLYVAHGIPLCLALFLTADLMTAAKRYVTVWDEYERLAPREIMARLMQDGGHFRVSMPVRSGIYPVWQQYVFPKRHIVVVDSVAQSTDPMERQVVEALARDPFRFWQITSTRDVLAPVAALDSLLKHPSARIMGYFNVMQDGQVALADAARGQQAWIRVANVLPWAAVYPGLEVADDVSLSERLADPKWDPTRVTLVSESRDVPGGWDGMVPAEVVKYSPNRIELRARTTNAGVLVINDKYDPDWEAFVNGNAAPILRCNGMMRGVAVPSGESQIAFVYRPCWKAFLVQAAAMGIVVCWLLCHVGIVVAARRRQSRDADPHRRAPTRIMLCQSKRMWVTDLRARLHSFRQRVGPLWWYAILTFCAGRLGDLCNIYVGVFYLPAALSPEDLGTVDPVTRLVGFAAIPVAVISMVGAKYLSAYHARNENGKIKQFMRDMALLGFVSAILFVAALLATFESFRVRLGLDSRFLLPTLCALGVLSCWQPLVQVVLQGMQKFNTIAFLGVGGNALRVVLVLCLVPLLHLSGLLLATFVSGLTIVGLSLWSLKGFMSREISPVAYYAEWRDILLFARGIAVMAIVGNLQGFIEPFVVKHSLPVQDAAGYYMVCRFGYIPSWLVGAISFVLFPLLSHRHERGEDTRGYLRQALLVTLTVSVGGTLLLGVISKWLFGLMPQWQPFLPYAPLVWMIGLQVTLDSIISIYTTHEIACRRFRFLWMTVPMALLDIVVLYGSFGWGAFRDWLPESIWRTMDQSIPRTLTYAIVVMCATRLLAALALALNWWREEKTLGAPGSGSSTIIGSSETGVGSRVS